MSDCEKRDLFEARTGGYRVYRIPGIVVTSRGVVLAHCEARQGRGGDWDPIDIVMRRSLDGGATWQPPFVAMDHRRFGGGPINNFVCFADGVTGDVEVLFCHNYARVYSMRSLDDGLTFTDPVDVTPTFEAFRRHYPWRVIAVGPGHGIQLASGRLVVAAWMSDGTGGEFGPGRLGHRPSEVAVVFSDDHGRSWQAGDFVAHNEAPSALANRSAASTGGDAAKTGFRHPNETALVQLADGRVLANIRSEAHAHRRLISVSDDGVAGWSEPRFDAALVEAICCAGFVGFDSPAGSRRRFAFSHPGVLERTMPGGPGDRGIAPAATGKPFDRKRLTVRLSDDDCASWAASRVLEPGPAGYSDLVALPGGTILCLYECGLVTGMYDDRYLRLARFHADWIAGG